MKENITNKPSKAYDTASVHHANKKDHLNAFHGNIISTLMHYINLHLHSQWQPPVCGNYLLQITWVTDVAN